MMQACLIERERKEVKKCWDFLSVSVLGSCPWGEFVWSKLSVHQVYVKKTLLKFSLFCCRLFMMTNGIYRCQRKKMMMKRKIKGAVKKVNRDLLKCTFLPWTNLFSDISNNKCVFQLFTSCKAIVYFKIPFNFQIDFAVWILAPLNLILNTRSSHVQLNVGYGTINDG